MLLQINKFVSNSRSALREICSIPADCSVIEAARQLTKLSLKFTNTLQQRVFLQQCRKENKYPKNIANLKLPNLNQSISSKIDPNGQLKDLQPSATIMFLKQQDKIRRMGETIRKFYLKAEIDEKYLEIKWLNTEIARSRGKLDSVTTPRERRYINRIIDDHCQREKTEVAAKHSRKLELLLTEGSIKRHPGPTHRSTLTKHDNITERLTNLAPGDMPASSTDRPTVQPQYEQPETEKLLTSTPQHLEKNVNINTHPAERGELPNSTDAETGVSISAPGIYDMRATNILNKGRNYKLSPTKPKQLEWDFQTGVWRLIAAMRYSNAYYQTSRPVPDSSTTNNTPNITLHSVAGKFDKDLNPPPTATPWIEGAIKQLKESVEPLRQEIRNTTILRNHQKEDLDSLKDLKEQKNLKVLLTDKTNKIAIMDRALVDQKLADHLKEPAYQLLKEDPTIEFEKEANNLLIDISTDLGADISKPPMKHLLSTYSTAPELYPQAKDHKPTFPNTKVRVVQPINNSAVEKLDMIVSKVLIQINQLLPNRVKSTDEFLQKLRSSYPNNMTVPNSADGFQTSLDVENMYPTLPTNDRALNVIKSYIEKYKDQINMLGFSTSHILSMLEFVLSHTYIKSGHKFYLQKRGIGTGSHSSGAYAEILVDHTYKCASQKTNLQPEFIATYVDDAWLLWTSSPEDFEKYKDALNSVWQTVNFTYEMPDSGKLNFLDLTVELMKTGEITHQHYQKPTASGRYLHHEAHCSHITKTNIIRSETRRIIRNCKYKEESWPHLETLKQNLVSKSGYPTKLVTAHMLQAMEQMEKRDLTDSQKPTAPSPDYVLKIPYINEGFTRKVSSTVKKAGINARIVTQAGRSVKSLISEKTKKTCNCELCKSGNDCSTSHFVYQADCNTCGDQYIGASRRPLKNRLQEHESSFRLNNSRTTLGQHAAEHRKESNEIYRPKAGTRDFEKFLEFYNLNIVRKCKDTLETFINEGMLISSNKPKLNNMQSNGFIE